MAKKVKKNFSKSKTKSPTEPDSGKIEKGMVCTVQLWSDRVVYIVVNITESGKTVFIQRAKQILKRTPGATWVLDEERDEPAIAVRKNPEGHWRTINNRVPCLVYFGEADPYRDPSF